MKHVSDEIWVDFARDLLSSDGNDFIKSHLATGCATCAAAHDTWRSLAAFGVREANYQPATSVVRQAELLFKSKTKREVSAESNGIAQWVFDSFLNATAVPVGVRSGPSDARHLVYKLGDHTIHLKLEPESGSRLSVAGQLLSAGRESEKRGETEVLATRGEETILRTLANQFGEFLFEIENGDDITIELRMSGDQAITIKVPQVKK